MKAISMSEPAILPPLLKFFETEGKEGKRQTIRPGWKETQLPSKKEVRRRLKYQSEVFGHIQFSETKPRLKVGEQVQIMWHQRTSPKGSWFCSNCGKGSEVASLTNGQTFGGCPQPNMETKPAYAFPKIMGIVEIGSVSKIEMWEEMYEATPYMKECGMNRYGRSFIKKDGFVLTDEGNNKIAKDDGFKDAVSMFQFFDRTYKLGRTPRPFNVYGDWKFVSKG